MVNTQKMPVQKESAVNAALNIGMEDATSAIDLNQDESLGKKRFLAVVLMVLAALLIAVSGFFLFETADNTTSNIATLLDESQQNNDSEEGNGVSVVASQGTKQKADTTGLDATQDTSQEGASDVQNNSLSNSNGDSSQEASQNLGYTGKDSSDESTDSGSSNEVIMSPSDSNTVTVSVVISSAAVGNSVSTSQTITLSQGATVYDALLATGISVNATNSSMGIYVAAIGGLAEKQHGSMSGWTYYVNGVWANKSCGFWTLNDGDQIYWEYVTGVEKW